MGSFTAVCALVAICCVFCAFQLRDCVPVSDGNVLVQLITHAAFSAPAGTNGIALLWRQQPSMHPQTQPQQLQQPATSKACQLQTAAATAATVAGRLQALGGHLGALACTWLAPVAMAAATAMPGSLWLPLEDQVLAVQCTLDPAAALVVLVLVQLVAQQLMVVVPVPASAVGALRAMCMGGWCWM
jgi:hypothetical protein